MHPSLRAAVLVAAVAATMPSAARAQAQQAAPMPNFPAMGETAPDFTATATDSTGRAIPIQLSSLRGKVVVLAFFPLDRSRGCTAEMSKFRDEYKTFFGDGVVVLPTSIDTLGSHASWAKDAHFPFAMIADPTGEVANKYASQAKPGRPFMRTVFVIGKDGKIAYVDGKFGALSQDSYDKLEAQIKKAKES